MHKSFATKRSVLESASFFAALNESDKLSLLENAQLAAVDKSLVIWNHGRQVEFIGIVASGFVKMVTPSPTGAEIVTEIMGPGQVFGLLGAVAGSGCPQTAVAMTKTTFLKLSKQRVKQLANLNGEISSSTVDRAVTQLSRGYNTIARISGGCVQNRIASTLLLLAQSFAQEQASGHLIDAPVSRQDIADMTGTTVESVIRCLSKWKKQGILGSHGQRIVILNSDALRAILANSDFDHITMHQTPLN